MNREFHCQDCKLGTYKLFIKALERHIGIAWIFSITVCFAFLMTIYFCRSGFSAATQVLTEKAGGQLCRILSQ